VNGPRFPANRRTGRDQVPRSPFESRSTQGKSDHDMRSEQVWLPTNALELELDFFYLRRPTSATQLLLLVRDGSRLKWT